LFSRRAFDVAATSKGVKVFLNGEKIAVQNFEDYVRLFLSDSDSDEVVKFAHEVANPRWEVVVAASDKGFQQMSFVNSIATTRGGKHVYHVLDQIFPKLTEMVQKKVKKENEVVNLMTHQIKKHLWVFVNCLIENPTFDSQIKDTMTLKA